MPTVDLRAHARQAVADYRRRQAVAVLTRPIEAARCALLSHLLRVKHTTGVLDEDALTRAVVATISAYLGEPVADVVEVVPEVVCNRCLRQTAHWTTGTGARLCASCAAATGTLGALDGGIRG